MGDRGAKLFDNNFIATHRNAICSKLIASQNLRILDPGFNQLSYAAIRASHLWFNQVAKITFEDFCSHYKLDPMRAGNFDAKKRECMEAGNLDKIREDEVRLIMRGAKVNRALAALQEENKQKHATTIL